MIIHDFDIVGVVVFPQKTDPPLIIDSDGVLPTSIPFQFFQPNGRRHSQILQARRPIEHSKFAKGDPLEGIRQPSRTLAPQEPLGLLILE
jgi:hypothetical protein